MVLQLCVYADDSKAAGGETERTIRGKGQEGYPCQPRRKREAQPEDACRVSRQEGGQGAPERRRRPEAGSLHPAEKGNFGNEADGQGARNHRGNGEQDARGRRGAKEEAKGKQEAMSERELIMTGILALALAVVVALRTAAR